MTSVRKSLSITGVAQAVLVLLGFLNVIVVSRLLTPAEIGIYSVAVSVLAFAHVFREFGVGNYLIQVTELSSQHVRAAFTVALLTSWGIASILVLVSGSLGQFYQESAVTDVMRLLAINFVLMPFGTPLRSVFRREQKFGQLAVVDVFAAITQTFVTICAAMLGESYLSLVWGAIAQQCSIVVSLNLFRPGQVFLPPAFRGLREVLQFGSISSLASLVSACGNSAPSLIFGRTLGFTDVAYFSRAVGVRKMLITNLLKVVRSVHFPVFAQKVRAGGSPDQLYCEVMSYMAVVAIPALVFVAIVAEPLILLLFGVQWARSAPLATLLCLYAVITSPYMLWQSSVVAVGKVGLVLRVQLLTQSIKVLVLISSIWLPLADVVVLLGISYVAEVVACQRALRLALGLEMAELFVALKSCVPITMMTVAGPLLLFTYYWNFTWTSADQFLYIVLSGVLALLGWVLGIFMLRHPIKYEVESVYKKIKRMIFL